MLVEPTDSLQKINEIAGEVMAVLGTYDATLMKYFHAQLFFKLLCDVSCFCYRRIATFSAYEKPLSYTYAFDKLPKDRAWGVFRPFDDKSMLLRKLGINQPYIVLIVGWVSCTRFFDRESNPASQVSINVVPVHDSTGMACQASPFKAFKTCNRYVFNTGIIPQLTGCGPRLASTEDGWNDVLATKWQNTQGVGGNGTVILGSKSGIWCVTKLHRPSHLLPVTMAGCFSMP